MSADVVKRVNEWPPDPALALLDHHAPVLAKVAAPTDVGGLLALVKGQVSFDHDLTTMDGRRAASSAGAQLDHVTALVRAGGYQREADACLVRAQTEGSAARRAAATEHARVEAERELTALEVLKVKVEAGDTEIGRLAELRRHDVELRRTTLIGIAWIVLAAGASMAAVLGVLFSACALVH